MADIPVTSPTTTTTRKAPGAASQRPGAPVSPAAVAVSSTRAPAVGSQASLPTAAAPAVPARRATDDTIVRLQAEMAALKTRCEQAESALASTDIPALMKQLKESTARCEELQNALNDHEERFVMSIPRFPALIDADLSVADAIETIDSHVAKAVEYAKKIRAAVPSLPPKLEREQTGPYRVIETKRGVNYGGGLTDIPVGTIVDMRSYGARGIASLREQGVKMELILDVAG